jgi:hypothetical protein
MVAGWRRAATVTTLALAGCTSAPDIVVPPSSPSLSPVSTATVTIEGLEFDEPRWKADGSNWRLVLSWQAPAGVTVDHYEIRRDGVTIADDVVSVSFRDTGVEPGARYRYSVTGLDADGRATQPAMDSIRTDEPPVGDARLEGSFVVRMEVERATGTRDPVRGGAIYFRFEPRCGSGACSARWTVRRSRAEGTLRRSGASYSAGLRTPFFVRNCFGRLTDEALDVRLGVEAAAPVRGSWRATKIEGTITEVSKHPGCVTASIVWAVRGTLQG